MILALALMAVEPPHVIPEPPARFQHDQNVDVFFTNDSGITSNCPEGSYSCANDKIIFLPNPCTIKGDWFAAVVCHELGHVNGWTQEHEK